MTIQRFFKDEDFLSIQNDFKFLIKFIKESGGEYDFAIRDNYFNIYYKGNSLAKVTPKKNEEYKVSIHNDFFDEITADDPKYYKAINKGENYTDLILKKGHLHPFFQVKNMRSLSSHIKERNYGEEIYFEQTLITDNLNRKKYIIIDRQVTDTILKGKRMDLLLLKYINDNRYQFVVAEVKLGNNKELKEKVAKQLDYYVKHIDVHFVGYQACYELQYKQKKKLGLIEHPAFSEIQILPPVEGIIIVGGYSGIAKKYIDELKKTSISYPIKRFRNVL